MTTEVTYQTKVYTLFHKHCISHAAYTYCVRHHLNTAKDLWAHLKGDAFEQRQLGKKDIERLTKIIQKLDCVIEDVISPNNVIIEGGNQEIVVEDLKGDKISSSSFEDKVNIFNTPTIKQLYCEKVISRRSYNICLLHNIRNIKELQDFKVRLGTFSKFRNCGQKTQEELERILTVANVGLQQGEKIQSRVEAKEMALPVGEEVKKITIQQLYHQRIISIRSYHICQAYDLIYVSDLLGFKKKNLSFKFLRGAGEKTIAELDSVIMKIENNQIKPEDPYPFLLSYEKEFVKKIEEEYGYTPVLYMLNRYMPYSHKESDNIYAKRFGIGGGQPISKKNLATLKNMTQERIRQILFAAPQTPPFFVTRKTVHPYKILKNRIIVQGDEILQTVIEREQLQDLPTFTVFGLISLLFPCAVIETQNGDTLVPQEYFSTLRGAPFRIEKILSLQKIEDRYVDPLSLISSSESNIEKAYPIIVKFLSVVYRLSVNDMGYVVFPQNKVNVQRDLQEILSEAGEPLHITTLFDRFQNRHPGYISDMNKLRTYLQNCERIEAIGKKSTYGLTDWHYVYYGSIRDRVREILAKSDIPLHIDDITNRVLEVIPTTNKKNINASLLAAEDTIRFYGGSFFGLVGKSYDSKYEIATQTKKETFDQRLQRLEQFITNHQRFPFTTGGDEEQGLRRWIYHIERGNIELSKDQKTRYDAMKQEYAMYPNTADEYAMLQRFDRIKDFIEKNHRLPGRYNESERGDYDWLHTKYTKRQALIGNKARYLRDFIEFIHSYGFEIFEEW